MEPSSEHFSARGNASNKLDYGVPHVARPYSANSRKGSPHTVPPLDLQDIINSKEPFNEATGIAEEDECGNQFHSGRTANDWASDQSQFAHLPPLPEGWIRVRSRTSGAIYFCYTLTGETTFTEPTAPGALGGAGADTSTGGGQDLPPGWTEVVSRSTGQIYYWNSALQKSQFEKPMAENAPAEVQMESADLPAGWVAMVSRSTGKTYYFNSETQQSQFERP